MVIPKPNVLTQRGKRCISHGGNFLDGTEYRGSCTDRGDWVEFPSVYSYINKNNEKVFCDSLQAKSVGYGANGYPSYNSVKKIFDENTQPRFGDFEVEVQDAPGTPWRWEKILIQE